MGTRSEDLLLGDEHEAVGRQDDAARERPDDNLDLRHVLVEPRRLERGEPRPTLDSLVAEEQDEPLGLRLRASHEKDAQPVITPVTHAAHERCERGILAPRGACRLDGAGEVVVAARGEVERVARGLEGAHPSFGFARDGGAVERDDPEHAEVAHDGLFVAVERLDEKGRPGVRLLLRVRLAPLDLAPYGPRDGGRIFEHHHSVTRDIGEHRVELVVVRRQERFGPEERAAVDDVVDERPRLGRRPVDQNAELLYTLSRAPRGGPVEDGLSRRGQP